MIIIIAVVLLCLLLVAFIVSVFMARYIMKGERRTAEDVYNRQSKICDLSFYDRLDKTEYTVKSFDGYVLHAELLKPDAETSKYIIISHGYSNTRLSALKFAKLYLKKGFNCIIYDLRGHGKNKNTVTTYGIREGKDICALIKDARKRYKDISVLGLTGESTGASASVFALKYTQDVDFVVADCGFADIDNVLRLGCESSHLPRFVIDFANIGATLFYRFPFGKMRPIDALEGNNVPVLFVHGEDDTFVVPDNSKRMFEKATCKKRLYLAKKAGHTKSIYVDFDKYSAEVDAFFKEIGIE